ncbi:pentapeptide repeat-containing protein [Actinoplanes sp. DH11]|uniref:pentapeptide repeat-containing protein n=1 Tax=Actinoplanes sp. DH11 TaxID=2857011 RepID=UPI001E5A7C9A|nr:pentapeptide repeat-containing protein [Actinoplanes sp. DH11]
MTAQRVAKIFGVVGLLMLLFFLWPDTWPAKELVNDLYANASTSLLSISVTVLLIDRLNESRAAQQDRKRLIREMGSGDSATALRAAKEIIAGGWSTDGSLRGADLARANLAGVRLGAADFTEANLTNAVLLEAEMPQARLHRALLKGAQAEQCVLKGSDLSGANMAKIGLAGANLESVTIDGDCELLRAEFQGASMRNAILAGAQMEECDLRGCDLTEADLRTASLRKATVSGAIFDRAVLERCDLTELREWRKIASMKGAQIAGIRNAPDGFRELALQLGAVE